jgi:dipeptidyl aminopeptidase/acylaminoacyl peptidase
MRLRSALAPVLAVFIYGCATLPIISLQELADAPVGGAAQFFYDSEGGRAEGYLIRPRGEGPFPLMVLLHGHSWRGDGATRLLPVAEQLSKELCYASLAISLPGYGMTEVPGDKDDKETISRVVLDGISTVGKLPWVDRKRMMLYGFSRGAVFAATLAGKVRGLRSVVLHSGAYDLPRLYQETPSPWVRRSLNPNGESNPHLFSIIPEVSAWTAPTLILHGGNDHLVPTNQAYLLRDRLQALRKPFRFAIFPEAGHRLPADGVKEEVLSFLSENVGSACER